MDFAQDGELTCHDPIDIAEAVLWEGDPQALIDALISCGIGEKSGFIERQEDRLFIHDWEEYIGKLIEKRRSDAERKRRERHAKDVPDMSVGHPTDGAGTVPNRTVPNTTNPDPLDPPRAMPAHLGGDAPLRMIPSTKHAKSQEVPRPATADEYWDALREGIGHGPMPGTDENSWNKAIHDFKAMGVTPAEIVERAQAFRKKKPTLLLTAANLMRFWQEIDHIQESSRASPAPSGGSKKYNLFDENPKQSA